MRTVRFGVFETNSSSCHSVTILSDDEYKALKEQKAIIKDSVYREVTKEEIGADITSVINFWEGTIERDKKTIKLYEKFLKITEPEKFFKELGKQTEDRWELRKIYDKKYELAVSELKDKIEHYKRTIEESKKTLEGLKSADLDKVTKLAQEYVEDHREIDTLDREDFECSDAEFDIIEDFLNCAWTYESYGGEYENTDESSRTINGVTVHVLSYSGYDG